MVRCTYTSATQGDRECKSSWGLCATQDGARAQTQPWQGACTSATRDGRTRSRPGDQVAGAEEFSSRRRTGAGAKRAIGCGPAGAVRQSRARPDAPKLCRNVEDQREKGRVDLARQPEARSGDQLVAHERDPGRGHGRV